MNWCKNLFQQIGNWWNDHKLGIFSGLATFGHVINRIVRNATRLVVTGIIINIIATYFYPEFPERFPIIYEWFDGWLQLGEFAMKTALGALYSVFTGNLSEFYAEYTIALDEMWAQFLNWLSHISF